MLEVVRQFFVLQLADLILTKRLCECIVSKQVPFDGKLHCSGHECEVVRIAVGLEQCRLIRQQCHNLSEQVCFTRL